MSVSYDFTTKAATAITETVTLDHDVTGVALTIEFSDRSDFATVVLSKTATGAGKNVTFTLTATEVDSLKGGRYRAKAANVIHAFGAVHYDNKVAATSGGGGGGIDQATLDATIDAKLQALAPSGGGADIAIYNNLQDYPVGAIVSRNLHLYRLPTGYHYPGLVVTQVVTDGLTSATSAPASQKTSGTITRGTTGSTAPTVGGATLWYDGPNDVLGNEMTVEFQLQANSHVGFFMGSDADPVNWDSNAGHKNAFEFYFGNGTNWSWTNYDSLGNSIATVPGTLTGKNVADGFWHTVKINTAFDGTRGFTVALDGVQLASGLLPANVVGKHVGLFTNNSAGLYRNISIKNTGVPPFPADAVQLT